MLTPEQIIIIGIAASALTFVLRALATYGNIHLGRFLANVLLFIVSLGLTVFFTHPVLPPISTDISAWIMAVVALISPLVAFASLIYNMLYDQVVVPLWARIAKK